jgi:hypothetical protein
MKIKNKERIDELVSSFYQNRNGFSFDHTAFNQLPNKEHAATTYGEIKYIGGVDQIVEHLRLDSDDVFVDLGCGTGRAVVEMFLSTPVKRAIGYELVKERYDHAMEVRNMMINNPLYTINKKSNSKRHLEFYNQNIVDADLSKATVVYLCSTCFSNDLLGIIVEKLAKCKKLKAVFTLATLPDLAITTAKLVLKESFPVETTWSKASTCHQYVPVRVKKGGSGSKKRLNETKKKKEKEKKKENKNEQADHVANAANAAN